MKSPQEEAFEQIVSEHKATIYSVCYMYTRDADEVADLFQDCMINIWRGLPGFMGKSGISTWVYRIALNTCISAGRKKKARGQTVTLDVAPEIAAPDEPSSRQTRLLHDRIQTLGPLDRAIVLLWLEDLPYEEIAEIVGISPRNVGVRLYRIKEQLKSRKQ